MDSIDSALAKILKVTRQESTVPCPLSEALGRILAHDVVSDIDSPPFDKSLMDGFAVHSSDLASGKRELIVDGTITAGTDVTGNVPLQSGHCWRIMTGAPIPSDADAVVMVERSSVVNEHTVRLSDRPVPGQFILRKAVEMSAGEQVLFKGTLLSPAEIGTLAAVGAVQPIVYDRPKVSIVATGDEIVDCTRRPGVSQIRNSNGPMIEAIVRDSGGTPVQLGIASDDQADLKVKLAEGLRSSILIVSGGVSAGIRDLVPKVLASLGVQQVLHHVNLKPGKPLWVGEHQHGIVFGLPGNPVSVFCCFHLFVKPALRKLSGSTNPEPLWRIASLTTDWHYRTERVTCHPVRLSTSGGELRVTPVSWFGSPDLKALARANAFAELTPDESSRKAGARLRVLPFQDDQIIGSG